MSGTFIAGVYDVRLVVLSVFIASMAAYTAVDLSARVFQSQSGARRVWIACGALVLGLGIWSMHYLGMLAFRLPVPVLYDWPTVGVSLMAAVFASAVALSLAVRDELTLPQTLTGSVFMGSGIAGMHYIGMAAMRLPAMCHYSPPLLALSIIVAVAVSFVALKATFSLREREAGHTRRKVVAAIFMGAAISGMHYIGMAAASFTAAPLDADSLSNAIAIPSLGVIAVCVVPVLTLGLALVGSSLDRRITLQSRQLDRSEERYRLIVQTAVDAFLGVDGGGRINGWNLQSEAAFGWTAEEAQGRPVADFLRMDEGEPGEVLRRTLTEGASASERHRAQATGLRRDGTEFPLALAFAALSDSESPEIAAFARDRTLEREAEAERQRAMAAAEAASRAKSDFLANISHEIRTPLNGVIGMTDLVLEGELSAEQRGYLEIVKLSADSLLQVINEVLDFSKIEAGKLELEETDFDLSDCMESTLKTLALRADEKNVELLCEIAPDVPAAIRGDSVRLRQVFTNLVGNAIKFTRRGEIALRASLEGADEDGWNIHFVVSDTGIGIAAEKLKIIFEPFAQADTSTTREYGGSGLGLPICRRLVEMMGGRIWVESELGKGSQFHFTARVSKTRSTLVQATAPSDSTALIGLRVLVVDDNETNRRILDGLLRHWKMRPTAVENGAKALEALQAAHRNDEPFDLILTDMQMPGMDGFDLIQRIRQQTNLVASTIMMLTSGGRRGDALRCQELGVAGYLLKPIRQSELREAIIRAVSAQPKVEPVTLLMQHPPKDRRTSDASLRILLAEDNQVNQLLALRLLEKRGHRVTVAPNGRAALELLDAQPFDLVLMDVNMPEMDGIQATVALREKELESGKHIPVFAMTAMVMKGDKERCIEAGMDGYLSKPLRQQELDEVLDAQIARLRKGTESATPRVGPLVSVLDESELMERLGGDVEFLSELTEVFREDYPRQLSTARRALAERDAEGVKRAGHTLRGALANLGATGPSRTAAKIEALGNAGDLSAVDAALAGLEQELTAVLASLQSLCQQGARG